MSELIQFGDKEPFPRVHKGQHNPDLDLPGVNQNQVPVNQDRYDRYGIITTDYDPRNEPNAPSNIGSNRVVDVTSKPNRQRDPGFPYSDTVYGGFFTKLPSRGTPDHFRHDRPLTGVEISSEASDRDIAVGSFVMRQILRGGAQSTAIENPPTIFESLSRALSTPTDQLTRKQKRAVKAFKKALSASATDLHVAATADDNRTARNLLSNPAKDSVVPVEVQRLVPILPKTRREKARTKKTGWAAYDRNKALAAEMKKMGRSTEAQATKSHSSNAHKRRYKRKDAKIRSAAFRSSQQLGRKTDRLVRVFSGLDRESS